MRSNPYKTAAQNDKAEELADAVLAVAPDLQPGEVERVLSRPDVRGDAEAVVAARRGRPLSPGSRRTWGLAGGIIRQRLADRDEEW